jgi:hypothetical protein
VLQGTVRAALPIHRAHGHQHCKQDGTHDSGSMV